MTEESALTTLRFRAEASPPFSHATTPMSPGKTARRPDGETARSYVCGRAWTLCGGPSGRGIVKTEGAFAGAGAEYTRS